MLARQTLFQRHNEACSSNKAIQQTSVYWNDCSLSIMNLDVDAQMLMSLSRLCPNIRTLECGEEENGIRYVDDEAKPIYQQALSNWKKLERIRDKPNQLQISTYILGSCTLGNLKELEVSFKNYSENEKTGNQRLVLSALISNIYNAPSLEKINISQIAVTLNDIECLHDRLPKLRELKFDFAGLCNEDDENLTISSSAKNTEAFITCWCPMSPDHINSLQIQRTIVKWISFIEQKYQNLKQLELHIYSNDFDRQDTLEKPLINAIANMKRIEAYSVTIFFLTEHVMHTMEKNNISLRMIKLDGRLYQQQSTQVFQLVQSSS